MEKVIYIKGLDCPNCALELQEELEKIDGLKEASVDFINQKVTVNIENKDALNRIKEICNNFEEVKVIDSIQNVINICNLDCPNCALELQEEIDKLLEVEDVIVDFVNQKVIVTVVNENALDKVKNICNNFEEVKVVEDQIETLKIEGLDCPNCALELQEEIEKIEGVKEASVDFVNQKVSVTLENKKILKLVKNVCNNFEEVKVVEEETKTSKISHKKEIICIIVSAILLIVSLIIMKTNDFEYSLFNLSKTNIQNNPFLYVLSLITFLLGYVVVAYPILINTVKNVSKGRWFDENFLMALASLGAVIIGELVEGVAVVLLYQIGELLQTMAVEQSRNSITNLVDLQAESATLIKENELVIVSPEELKEGDIIQIKKGEKVPVDSKIIKGSSAFDTKSLTGEAMLKDCKTGDEILSGYINQGEVIEAQCIKKYQDSAVAKIMNLIENTSTSKSQPEKFITKFAKYYTPIVISAAAVVALIVPLIISLLNGNWGENYLSWVYRSLTLLVISCPCAVVISVPLTYFGGLGACAKRGVLVKGTTFLDELTNIKTASFDKTGTLTEGKFYVTKVEGEDKDLVLKIACIAEKGSTHPIAKAFDNYEINEVATKIEEVSGKGLKCVIDDKQYLVGNEKLIKEEGIELPKLESYSTIIYVADNDKLLGYIEIDDKEKDNVQNALKALKNIGIKQLVMLSGDNKKRVESVANKIGIDKAYGELLPDEKLEKVKEFKQDGKVLYVGDGINDAPVMIEADVSISMGKLGSDAAIEASDIVLVSDNIEEVVNAITLAKKTKAIVYQNIIFSIAAKIIFMMLGVASLIPLWLAVFADVGVMLIAVVNSLRMKITLKK